MALFKGLRTRTTEAWHDFRADDGDSRKPWFKIIAGLVVVYVVVMLVLGIYWSAEPDTFSVVDTARAKQPHVTAEGTLVTGVATTATLMRVTESLLDKPGGFLSNDIAPPGALLDNIPSWEYGVLIQARDLTRVLRESYSRSQSQSKEDDALKLAEAQFNFNNQSWILPASEEEYRRGLEALEDYLIRLVDEDQQNAQFFTRADNLGYWLATVETRLGSLSQNLSASVGQRRLNTDLAGDAAARQATATSAEVNVKTALLDIDNVFYEARGSTWALIHFLEAAEIDFADVLEKKNARVSLRQIIRELEGTQQTVYSPIILNGSGFGVLANHSLVMANYISRANAAIIDLRELLARG